MEDNQTPSECKHYIPLCSGCNLNITETRILGGGYWVKCCDIADDPDFDCPDYQPKEKKDGKD